MNRKRFLSPHGAKTVLLLLSTTTLLATTPSARADSPSDLMEQGIYSEETTGDLNGAVQLYQKVIAQAKTDHALAAQAQYHLGMCFYKQKNFADANTAFETVIKDYPDQKELVGMARKYLSGANALLPAPWTDCEDMRLDIKLGTGLKVGVADFMINSGQATNGQKIWRCSSHTTIGPIQSVSHAEVDADTFSPIHSIWKHSLLGEVDAVYYSDHADLKTTGKDEVKKIDFAGPTIDNEETLEWMRRLPLMNGYKCDQPLLASLMSHIIPVKFEVSGPEKVTVPAGTYDCYKVALSINQTFWYSSDTNRYLVKFEAGGAVGELAQVTHLTPGQPVAYADATNGFSLSAPEGWSFDRLEAKKKDRTHVLIIDPEGLAASSVALQSIDSIEAADKKSLRDYANGKLDSAGKMYNNFQIRTNSWKDRTVDGQPALSVVTDWTEGKDKKVGYGVWSFGQTNGVYFEMITSAKDFDALQPKMDAIIDSYKTK